MPFTNSSVVPYGLLVMHAMDIYRKKTCPPAPFIMPPPPTGGGTIMGTSWVKTRSYRATLDLSQGR